MSTPKQAASSPSLATAARLVTFLAQKQGLTTLTAVQIFLLIGRREGADGVLVRDVVKATGITQSAVARIVAALSDQPVRGQKAGLNWLQQRPDSDDPRRVRIFTTEMGQRVLAEIETIMA